MSQKLTALADRRRKLVQKISEQRTELSELMRQWQKPLAVADSGLKVIRVVRGHPAWLASGLAALLAWRLKGIAGTTQRGWPLAYLYSSAIFAGTKLLSTLVPPLMKKHDKAVDDSEDR